MKPIRTIIVDDEPDFVKLLNLTLKNHCPEVEVIGAFTNPQKALVSIEKQNPELLILDILMPNFTGFELVEKVIHLNPSIIFMTASDEFFRKALDEFNTLDYLVKPISISRVKKAITKAQHQLKPCQDQIDNLKKCIQSEAIYKIPVHENNGITLIDLDEINYFKANDNYTEIHLVNEKMFIISKTLKVFQDMFEECTFFRTSRQYIIKIKNVKALNRSSKTVTMANGAQIPISADRIDALMNCFKKLI